MRKKTANQAVSEQSKVSHTSEGRSLSKQEAVSTLPEDERMAEVSRRIRQLRIEKGYSSAEIFAYEHDLNRSSYWRMEKGYNMTLRSLLNILDIHGLSLKEFFCDFDQTNPQK